MVQGRRLTDAEAEADLRAAGAEPLVPYPGSNKAWLSRCLTCGSECRPQLNDIRNHGQGSCRKCQWLSNEIAEANLKLAGAEPLVPYPGTHKPWLSRCLTCGSEGKPRLGDIRKGGGACKFCAWRRGSLNTIQERDIFNHCDLYVVSLRWPDDTVCGKIGISVDGSRRRGNIERESGATVELIRRWETTQACAMWREYQILNGPLLHRSWRLPEIEAQSWSGRTETFPLKRASEVIQLVGDLAQRSDTRIGTATVSAWENIKRLRAGNKPLDSTPGS